MWYYLIYAIQDVVNFSMIPPIACGACKLQVQVVIGSLYLFFLQSTSHSSQFDVDIKYTCLLIPGLPKRCGLPIAGLAAGIENCWDWELHEDLDVENDERHPNHLLTHIKFQENPKNIDTNLCDRR